MWAIELENDIKGSKRVTIEWIVELLYSDSVIA